MDIICPHPDLNRVKLSAKIWQGHRSNQPTPPPPLTPDSDGLEPMTQTEMCIGGGESNCPQPLCPQGFHRLYIYHGSHVSQGLVF